MAYKSLGEMFVSSGDITEEQLKHATDVQKKTGKNHKQKPVLCKAYVCIIFV